MEFADLRELQAAADMAGLEMEFFELREAAMRWEWLVRHATSGFDAAPSWNGGIVRLPVFDSADQHPALVDRARAAEVLVDLAKTVVQARAQVAASMRRLMRALPGCALTTRS